jgi:hypothetical protein
MRIKLLRNCARGKRAICIAIEAAFFYEQQLLVAEFTSKQGSCSLRVQHTSVVLHPVWNLFHF